MTPSRDIARLLEIMAALRTRGTGCPWDLQQTFETIAPRRYAASTLLGIVCPRACSRTSCGNAVLSAAQSLKLERKP